MTRTLVLVSIVCVGLGWPARARAQADPFVGQLMLVGFNFCPQGWARADGSLLQIQTHQALFALLGTTYGGNGLTTFALPDLRGRAPIHQGQGLGLTPRSIGESGGQESVTLSTAQLPAHSHALNATSSNATTASPNGTVLARKARVPLYRGSTTPDVSLAPTSIGVTGSGQPVPTQSPFLAMTWCIALQGVFPTPD